MSAARTEWRAYISIQNLSFSKKQTFRPVFLCFILENKIKDLGVYKDPIDHIVSQKYESYFCGAGSEQLTIDSNGDIYLSYVYR